MKNTRNREKHEFCEFFGFCGTAAGATQTTHTNITQNKRRKKLNAQFGRESRKHSQFDETDTAAGPDLTEKRLRNTILDQIGNSLSRGQKFPTDSNGSQRIPMRIRLCRVGSWLLGVWLNIGFGLGFAKGSVKVGERLVGQP